MLPLVGGSTEALNALSSLSGTGSTQKIVLAELIIVDIGVAYIMKLRTCVIKIVTFKGRSPNV